MHPKYGFRDKFSGQNIFELWRLYCCRSTFIISGATTTIGHITEGQLVTPYPGFTAIWSAKCDIGLSSWSVHRPHVIVCHWVNACAMNCRTMGRTLLFARIRKPQLLLPFCFAGSATLINWKMSTKNLWQQFSIWYGGRVDLSLLIFVENVIKFENKEFRQLCTGSLRLWRQFSRKFFAGVDKRECYPSMLFYPQLWIHAWIHTWHTPLSIKCSVWPRVSRIQLWLVLRVTSTSTPLIRKHQ